MFLCGDTLGAARAGWLAELVVFNSKANIYMCLASIEERSSRGGGMCWWMTHWGAMAYERKSPSGLWLAKPGTRRNASTCIGVVPAAPSAPTLKVAAQRCLRQLPLATFRMIAGHIGVHLGTCMDAYDVCRRCC